MLSIPVAALSAAAAVACSDETPRPTRANSEARAPSDTAPIGGGSSSLPSALALSYAQFGERQLPGPARLEIISRRGATWEVTAFEDADANVFHGAVWLEPPGERPGLVTISGVVSSRDGTPGGSEARARLWRPAAAGGFTSTDLWAARFGGLQNRMRDIEAADVDGDGRVDLVIGTHDRGVVALVSRPEGTRRYRARELDRREEPTFVHEIEVGDLDRDGVVEVYATVSEPNTLGGTQRGEVVRYVPRNGAGRHIVASLGNRHAKEILVTDADGDGTDELYVVVEALTEPAPSSALVEPVAILRYDVDTRSTEGQPIASIRARSCRFLAAGDLDGDGRAELVATASPRGVWLLRPGSSPSASWSMESVDEGSGGFEHAALIADLDEDGRSELYVASDDDGELRRYVWEAGRPRREVIHRRPVPRSMVTWNIAEIPSSFVDRVDPSR